MRTKHNGSVTWLQSFRRDPFQYATDFELRRSLKLKLIIKRDQNTKTGWLGNTTKFKLDYRAELTPDEAALVDKYDVGSHPLLFIRKDGEQVPCLTVASLLRGQTDKLEDVTTLLSTEENLKSACRHFRNLLEVMATFGGEEVLEF